MRLKPPPYDPFSVGRLVQVADDAGELLESGALTDADLKTMGRRLRQVAALFHNDPPPPLLELTERTPS